MGSWHHDFEDLARQMEEWNKNNHKDFVLGPENQLVRFNDDLVVLHNGEGLTRVQCVLTPAQLLSLIVFAFKSGYLGTGLLNFSFMSDEHPGAPWLGKHGLGAVKQIVKKPDWWEVDFQPGTASMVAFAGRADHYVAAFAHDGYIKTKPLQIYGFNFDGCQVFLRSAVSNEDVAAITSRIERGDKVMLTWVRGDK